MSILFLNFFLNFSNFFLDYKNGIVYNLRRKEAAYEYSNEGEDGGSLRRNQRSGGCPQIWYFPAELPPAAKNWEVLNGGYGEDRGGPRCGIYLQISVP